jgi:hypothetical protein
VESTPGYLPQRNESLSTKDFKKLCPEQLHIEFINWNQNQESIKRRMNKGSITAPWDGIQCSHERGGISQTLC